MLVLRPTPWMVKADGTADRATRETCSVDAVDRTIVARFVDMPFSEIENRRRPALNTALSDWRVAEVRPNARGVL